MKKSVIVLLFAIILIAMIFPRLELTSGQTEEAFLTYATAGVFGPQSGTETISGDVLITHPEIQLRNIKVAGNLYIGKDVVDGAIYLNRVFVEGAVVVLARGDTSLTLQNTKIAELNVGRTEGKISISAMGNTMVARTRIFAETDLTEGDELKEGFADVLLEGPGSLALKGNFNRVHIHANNGKLSLLRGTIRALQVGEEAAGSKVYLAEGTSVTSLELLAAAIFEGSGMVSEVEIHAAGAIFEFLPQAIQAEQGIEVRTGIVVDDADNPEVEDSAPRAVIIYKIDSLALLEGQTSEIPVTTIPGEGVTLQAISSDSAVATVAVSAKTLYLTALRSGTARITVLANHPELDDAGAAFTVTVTSLNEEEPPLEEPPLEEPPLEEPPLEEPPLEEPQEPSED